MSVLTPKPVEDLRPELVRSPEGMVLPAAETGIRAIIAADRRFDVNQFAEGAKSAYRMVLEAFWKGDREERGYLCDADEIGRASCRERVWQYVSITGVAVSLKITIRLGR